MKVRNEILTTNPLITSLKEQLEAKRNIEMEETEVIPECAVCLQPSIHPVKLPCNHIFCFLCVKGVTIQSQRW